MSKIAKKNQTTVSVIANDNKISNPNKIQAGKKIIIKTKYLRHKPAKSAIIDILNSSEMKNLPIEAVNFSRNCTIKPSKSNESNKIRIQTSDLAKVLIIN